MAKLQFSLDGNSLGEYALDKERITIGRRPSNDIHIDNLAVSGEHAIIVTIGDNSFLEDLNSTNGTLVNHKPVKKHVLLHKDEIEFGKYQLIYINEAQAGIANLDEMEKSLKIKEASLNVPTISMPSKSVQSAEKLAIDQPEADQLPADQNKSDIEATPTEPAVKVARLQLLNGASAGRELMLNKALTTLGKPGSQVAVITKRPNGYFITHVEGDNLPFVNGQIAGIQAHALNDHDVVELAGVKMEFFIA
jgi:pSer/pThr/pTyr-binding forkhead associated (FHA) protein